MKNLTIVLTAAIVAGVIASVGAAHAYTQGKTQGNLQALRLVSQMSIACEHKVHPQCTNLIHQVQADGEWQVYADTDGSYWVEPR